MQAVDRTFGIFAIGCAALSAILLLVDFVDTPLVLEYGRYELAFASPLGTLADRPAFPPTEEPER